jgi:chemotaxis protein methyltransferase WspC
VNLAPVIALVRERIGLDPESLGPTALARAVAARLRALGLQTPDAYAARLAGDPQEFQALVGHLTVPETWFFRGDELFVYLARHIGAAAHALPPGARYRILSVPCSTGEEPYSLAIALLEAGVSPGAWALDAVDLDPRHVERACLGRYREFSFRQTAPELRQRYFRPTDGEWELGPAVRALVRFRAGNLLDPLFLAGEGPFDLVFCRNLLIYLDPAARRRALDALGRLLAPRGLLCTGHAEPLDFMDPRFERTGSPGYFLYRRAARAPEPHALAVAPPRQEPARQVEVPAPPASAKLDDLLTQAQQQADRGQLAEALATCQAQLTRSGPSADLFSLLGELHQARQEKGEAVRCFRRALYLDPAHRIALTHLMLLCRELGHHDEAARLRRRLDRATSGGEA